MKECPRCGCHNRDSRVMCVDCGGTLRDAAVVDESELDTRLERMFRYADPFAIKPRHWVFIWIGFGLCVVSVVLFIFSLINITVAIYSALAFLINFVTFKNAEFFWEIEKFFLEFKIRGEIEPSDWWYIKREIGFFMLFGAGVLFFVLALFANNSTQDFYISDFF